jgi:hypothetical protein
MGSANLTSSDLNYVDDGNRKTFAFSLTRGDKDGTIIVIIPDGVVEDPSGNLNIAYDRPYTVTLDIMNPDISDTDIMPRIESVLIPDIILTNTTLVQFTIDFTEMVSGFDSDDIMIRINDMMLLPHEFEIKYIQPNPATLTMQYTFEVDFTSLNMSDNHAVSIFIRENAVQDGVDRGNTASNIEFRIDNRPPIYIGYAPPDRSTGAASMTYNVTFSEPVRGLTENNIVVNRAGELSSGSLFPSLNGTDEFDDSYTFTVTRQDSRGGDVRVHIMQDAVQDEAGHGNMQIDIPTRFFEDNDPQPTVRRNSGGTFSWAPVVATGSHINGTDIKVSTNKRSGQTSSPIMLQIGDPITISLNIEDLNGAHQIKHVALYLDLSDEYPRDYWASDTYVVYEKFGKPQFTIRDVDNNLLSATHEIQNLDLYTTQFNFTLKFAKPLSNTAIAVHVWDNHNSASLLSIPNALKVTTGFEDIIVSVPPVNDTLIINDVNATDNSTSNHTSINNTNTEQQSNDTSLPDDTSDADALPTESTEDMTTEEFIYVVKQWAGYDTKIATDKDILYLLDILEASKNADGEDIEISSKIDLPKWAKEYLGEWAIKGTISYDEFIEVLAYLYENTHDSSV